MEDVKPVNVRTMKTSEIVMMLGDAEILAGMLFNENQQLSPEEIHRIITAAVATLAAELDRRVPIPPPPITTEPIDDDAG